MLHRAQETLAHKLGMLLKESSLNEVAIADYMHLFDGPLSQEAIAALSNLFKLDCNLTVQIDDALIKPWKTRHA